MFHQGLKRRNISFRKILLLYFFLFCTTIAFGGTVVSTVSPSNSNPTLGANIEVTISVNMNGMESPNNNLGSFTGSLSWNSSVLAYVSNSGILSGFTGVVNAGTNQANFSGINPTGVSGNFEILHITFNASGTGSSPLDLDYSAMVAAMTFENLLTSLTINDSQVTVGQTTEYSLTLAVSPTGTGTTIPSVGSHTYTENTVVNISATPNSGYQFSSWTGDVVSPSSASTTVTMNNNKSVTANFSAIQQGEVHSYAIPSNSTPNTGESFDVTISVDMGYMSSPDNNLGSFSGNLAWNSSVISYVSDSGILSGFTGVANAGSNQISFSGVNPTGVTGSFNILTITFSGLVAGTSILDLDYSAMVAAMTFTDLLGYLTIHDSAVTVGQIENVTLTMAVNPTGGGTTNPAVGDHDYTVGTVVDIEATPNPGYNFDQWVGDVANPNNAATTVTMSSDKTVTANFSANQQGEIHSYATPSNSTPNVGESFDVTVSVDMSGMSSPDNQLGSFSGTLAWDSSVISYVSDSGILSGFTGVANAGSNQISFSGVNPTGVTGSFNILTITFSGLAAGTSILDLDYSAMVAAITFTDLIGFLTIHDSAVTVGQIENVTLTMAVNPAGGGTTDPVVGDHEYPIGTEVDIEADANPGFTFSHWEGDVDDVNDPTTSIILNMHHTVTAHFTQNPIGEIHSYAIPSEENVSVGDPVIVTISVDMSAAPAPDDYLGSFSGSLSWDSSILAYSSNSGVLSDFTGIVNVTDGLISFNGANPTGDNGEFDILTITLNASTEGTSDLDLDYSAMAAANTFQNLIPDLTIHDGEVDVGQTENVTLTMAVNPSGGGTTDPAIGDHEYPIGTEVDIEAIPNSGYSFSHWQGVVNDVNDPTTSVILDTDQTVSAHFIIDLEGFVHAYAIPTLELISAGQTVDVTLSIDMTGMSTPDEALGSFTGMLVWDPTIISYVSHSGILSGFTGAVNPTTSSIGFNGANPAGVTETFDVLQITFSGIAEGLSPLNLTYSAMAASSSFRDLIPVLITHDDSVEVGSQTEYTLTITVNPAGSAMTEPSVGSHIFSEGTVVDLLVTPNAGFDFVGWVGDVADPFFEITTITMDEDKIVTSILELESNVANIIDATKPEILHLAQNYPNPFNPKTTLIFQIPDPGVAMIDVYNGVGQRVKSLLHGVMVPGTYQLEWDGTDDRGNQVCSGIYPIVLRTRSTQRAVKAFLMK